MKNKISSHFPSIGSKAWKAEMLKAMKSGKVKYGAAKGISGCPKIESARAFLEVNLPLFN
jgi:hypothetical protein